MNKGKREKKRRGRAQKGKERRRLKQKGKTVTKRRGEKMRQQVIYSENSFNLDDANKEEVLFKDGKIKMEGDKLVKSNKEERLEKCFRRGHKGACIISVRLKEKKTGNRGNANYTKLIDLIVRKGWRPEEAVKTGFRSADLYYCGIEREQIKSIKK